MEWQTLLGRVAGFVCLSAFVPYLVGMIRGKNHPSRASWWIWALLGFVLFASSYASQVRTGIWMPLAGAIGPVITAVFTLKYGQKGWEKFDTRCLIGAGASMAVWGITRSAVLALCCALIADSLGALPTIRHAYRKPQDEDRLAWILFALAAFLNLFAIKHAAVQTVAYPVYFFVVDTTIALLVQFPKKWRHGTNQSTA